MGSVIDIVRKDEDTGEYLDGQTIPGTYRIKIISDKSIEAFRLLRDGTVDIHRDERYVKVYPGRIEEILQDGLSYNELRIFNACMIFAVKFQTGELVHENMVPVTAEQICKTACVEQRRGYTALNQLVFRLILAKERRGRSFVYLANPFIFVCGNSITRDLFDRFSGSKWANMR